MQNYEEQSDFNNMGPPRIDYFLFLTVILFECGSK